MMMRIFNMLAVIMVFVAGFALYHMKFETQQLQDHVDALNRQIVEDQAETKVLGAEWAYLSSPQRLEELTSRYLDLKPAGPKQMLMTVANIQARPEDAAKVVRVAEFDMALPVGRHVAAIKVAETPRVETATAPEKTASLLVRGGARLSEPLTRRPFNPATDKLRLVSSDGDQHP